MKWAGPEKGLQERRGRGGQGREGFKEERAGLKRGSREGQGGAQVTRGWGREAEEAAVKKCPEEGGAREEKPWEGGAEEAEQCGRWAEEAEQHGRWGWRGAQ